ncbi:MAG: protein jag [SAR202 cluster bacterium]|nr:protein jag [SAR202 cluster bacterium]
MMKALLSMRRKYQMRRIETSGKTVEEAIEIGLNELDVNRTEVEIEVVSKGKTGILGIRSEPAKVTLTVVEKPTDLVKVATDTLQKLVARMDVSVFVNLINVHNEEIGGPSFEIDGEDAGLLIGRKGQTMRSLQFITTMISSNKLEDQVRIDLDVAGYKSRRYDSLANLAYKVAEQVVDTGNSITLEPMPANERRIIHVTLADDQRVSSVSSGRGDSRKVTINPSE